jgi:hypothetical protein
MRTGRSKHASTRGTERGHTGPPAIGPVVKAVDRYLTALAVAGADSALVDVAQRGEHSGRDGARCRGTSGERSPRGSPQMWSECLTALIRRSVVAWVRLGEIPELRELVKQLDLERGGRLFLVAIATEPADDPGLPLAGRSRLAMHRVTGWFNSQGDMWATLAAAVSATGVLMSTAATVVEETWTSSGSCGTSAKKQTHFCMPTDVKPTGDSIRRTAVALPVRHAESAATPS